LYVDTTPVNDSEAEVHFHELSPSEQRIFLESYTSDPSFSDVYSNGQAMGFLSIDSVEFRNSTYEIELDNTTCGPDDGTFVKRFGAGIILLGLVFPVLVTFWRDLRSR